MKLNLVILDEDQEFLDRFYSHALNDFRSSMNLVTFSSFENAVEYTQKNHFDIFLIDSKYSSQNFAFLNQNKLIYLSEQADIEEIAGIRAVSKYSSIREIFKFCLAHSEKENTDLKFKLPAVNTKVKSFAFLSAQARHLIDPLSVGFAKTIAQLGGRVLYIDLNMIAMTDAFLSSTERSKSTLSDIILDLKTGIINPITSIKLNVKTDASGVNFISAAANTADLLAFTEDIKLHFVKALSATEDFDFIIYNLPMVLDGSILEIYKDATQIFSITSGQAYQGFLRDHILEAFEETEKSKNIQFVDKIATINVAADESPANPGRNFPVIADISEYSNTETIELANVIADEKVFNAYLRGIL